SPVEAFLARREDRAEPPGTQACTEPVAAQHQDATGYSLVLLRGVHPDALRRQRAGPCCCCRRGSWYYWTPLKGRSGAVDEPRPEETNHSLVLLRRGRRAA